MISTDAEGVVCNVEEVVIRQGYNEMAVRALEMPPKVLMKKYLTSVKRIMF